jgi:tRNA threonylcarbamoyladenosine biosynthesis protein TsaE
LQRPLASLAATEALGAALAAWLAPGRAVLLAGPLGAGKTTLARAILRALCENPELDVPSPSYTLLQTYDTPRGPAHHLDLWRIAGEGDLIELGFEDWLADMLIIEWPDKLGALTPPLALTITLSLAGPEQRMACVMAPAGAPFPP